MAKQFFVVVVVCLAVGIGSPSFALNITLNDITPGGMLAPALTGFTEAAGLWEAGFSDVVTVRVDVGFEPLGPGVLGQASSNSAPILYSATQAALIGDQTSTDDAAAVGSLQPGPALEFLYNDAYGTSFFIDADGSPNNIALDVNTANAKALGLTLDANGVPIDDGVTPDATIEFNSDFTFDFNPTDGIAGGAYDFVGVAAHEIGHALGFVSGVDIVDLFSGAGPGAPFDLNGFAVFSTLDLYRFSDDSLAIGGPGTQDLAIGDAGQYFSIDGGMTNLGLFSTGVYNGDGRQASHWKDNLGLGIMDPTVASGELLAITDLDLQAFDVIGWDLQQDVIPEPSTVVLFSIGALGLLGYGWRRRKGLTK